MPAYYVMHPSIKVSATVDAPTTEKARTTFLDYLERTGRISRSSRQWFRKNMVSERIDDPNEVMSDVHLDYDHVSEEETNYFFKPELRPAYEEEIPFEREEPTEGEPYEDYYKEPEGKKMMPIQELALGENY